VLPKLVFARLLLAALLLLWLARIVTTRTLVIKRSPLDIPLVLFTASAALSSIFAENANVAVFGTYTRFDGLLTLATYPAIFWISAQSLTDSADARGLVRTVLASGYAVSLVAILQSVRDSLQQAGIAPAYGTLGNPNVLGAFLALVVTIGFAELLVARSAAARLLLGNVLVVAVVGLLLSLSRSSWLGALAGVAVALALRRRLVALRPVAAVAGAAVLVLVVGYVLFGSGHVGRILGERALSIVDPREIGHARLGIWGDSLRLVASRPIVGYGPDNVGLVFPRFQTGDWGLTYSLAAGTLRQPIDKAHAELLQVAATQGLIGVATYLLIQVAFLRAFWSARRLDQAVIAGAGWIAYTVVVQLNFSALAAALPFWMFASAAIWSCDAVRAHVVADDVRRGRLLLIPGAAVLAAAVWWGVVIPYLADGRLLQAVNADYAGDPTAAERLTAEARQLAPRESVYAVEAGNVAFERQRWPAAREAYRNAAELGTFNPMVYRNLALANRNLGLGAEGRAAAEKAVELDPFDPANQALLAEFGG